MEIKYAIYPGTVTLYNGSEVTYTASELATLYGVSDEPYLTVNNETEIPQGLEYFEYIHLYPRRDGKYYDIKDSEHTQDDDLMGENFNGNRQYTQETKHPYNDLRE